MDDLHLEEPCELDEGDVGPRSGVPTVEGPFRVYLEGRGDLGKWAGV